METGERIVKTRKRRSVVWKYFVQEEGTRDVAKCTVCDTLVKTPSGCTSDLGRHLAKYHGGVTGAGVVDEVDSEGKRINTRVMRKRKPSSHVWEYFVRSESRESAKCTICNTTLKTSGGCTTALLRHLESFHRIYGENSKSRPRGSKQGSESESDEVGNDSSSEESSSTNGSDSEYVNNSDEASENEDIPGKNTVEEVSVEGNNVEDVVATNIDGVKKRKRRQLRSPAWEFFVPTVNRMTAKCKICNVVLTTTGGSTTNLNRHLSSYHGGNLKGLRKRLKRRKFGRRTSKNKPSAVVKTEIDPLMSDPEDAHSPGGAIEEEAEVEEMESGGNHEKELDRTKNQSDKPMERKFDYQPGGKSCFVCNAKLSRESVPYSSQEEFRFFFAEILEIPTGKSLDYLERLERPEKWIDLCNCCHSRLVEALGARKKIIRLQLQLENCQRQILEILKGKGKTWKVDSTKYPEKQRQVVDLIKKYVHSRKYSILNSDDEMDVNFENQGYPETRRRHSIVADSPDPDPLQDEDLSDHFESSTSPAAHKNQLPIARSVSPAEVKIISTKKTATEADMESADGSKIKRRKLRSKIWNFFVPTEAREVARCKICNITMKTTRGSTTSLHRHLMGLHRKHFQAMKKKERRKLEPSAVIVRKPKPMFVKATKIFPGQRKTSRSRIFLLPVPCKSKSYRYRYDCPNCPNIKEYPMVQFAMHLGIHLRRPFQCTICSEFLPVDEDIQEHHWTEKHSDIQQPSNTDRFIRIKLDPGKIWKCESCEEGFFSEEDRDKHELSCLKLAYLERRKSLSLAERKPHQCQSCQLRFRNIAEWRLHRVLNHHRIDSMSCYYCDKSFCEMTVDGVEARHEQKLADHMNGDHGAMRVYDECESCGVVFDNRIEKREHFQERHGLPENMLYSCGVCGNANYSGVTGLRRHLTNTHFQSESSICDVCGTKFLHQRSLLHHRFQTHGIQPEGYEVLTCPQEGCGFKSILQENVRKHNWTVHMEAKFLCKYCGKAFKLKCNLKGHMELHLNKDSKPYQCEVCGVSYAVKNYLNVHKRLAHEGKREAVKKRYVYRQRKGQSQSTETEQAPTSSEVANISSSTSAVTDLQVQQPQQEYWD